MTTQNTFSWEAALDKVCKVDKAEPTRSEGLMTDADNMSLIPPQTVDPTAATMLPNNSILALSAALQDCDQTQLTSRTAMKPTDHVQIKLSPIPRPRVARGQLRGSVESGAEVGAGGKGQETSAVRGTLTAVL